MNITMPLEDVVIQACERVEELRPAQEAADARAAEALAKHTAKRDAAAKGRSDRRALVVARYEALAEDWDRRFKSRPKGWFAPSQETWLKENPAPRMPMSWPEPIESWVPYQAIISGAVGPAYFHEIERLSKLSTVGDTITLDPGLYAALFP